MQSYIRPETVTQERSQDMEAFAVQRLERAIKIIKEDLHWYWRWGDGNGAWLLEQIADAVRSEGFAWPYDNDAAPKAYKKASIGRGLARSVMERDEYRCVSCGTHIDLCCDHIIPESKGGPTVLENLQTMCRPCNSRKGVK